METSNVTRNLKKIETDGMNTSTDKVTTDPTIAATTAIKGSTTQVAANIVQRQIIPCDNVSLVKKFAVIFVKIWPQGQICKAKLNSYSYNYNK